MGRITYKKLEQEIKDWNDHYGLVYRDKGWLKVTNDGPVHELVQIHTQGRTGYTNLHLSDRNGTIRSCFDAIRHIPNPWNERPKTGVFTVGHEENYDQGMEKLGDKFRKLGRTGDYPGGFACQSIDSADRVIDRFDKRGQWAIYELECQWGVDTEESPNGWWHALINTSTIVRKVTEEEIKDEKRGLLLG